MASGRGFLSPVGYLQCQVDTVKQTTPVRCFARLLPEVECETQSSAKRQKHAVPRTRIAVASTENAKAYCGTVVAE